VEHAVDAIDRDFQSIGSDLCKRGFETLPDRRGADKDRDRAVGFERQSRILLRAGGTALDEAADPQSVIAAVDQLALKVRLFRPAELLQTAVEGQPIVTAVERVLVLVWGDRRDRIGHFRRRQQIAPAEFDTVDAEIAGDNVQKPLAEEIGLEPPRSAIGADRRLVGQKE